MGADMDKKDWKMRYFNILAVILAAVLIPGIILGYAYKPELPVFIYKDGDIKAEQPYYSPSCWLGDVFATNFCGDYTVEPASGKYCIKVEYDIQQSERFGWTMIGWTFPAYNWGDINGGLDLSGAGKMTFWAKGASGNESIVVKFGGNYGVYSDTAEVIRGPIKLGKKWKRYEIPLAGIDRSHISMGFALVIRVKENAGCGGKVTVFLDDIIIE